MSIEEKIKKLEEMNELAVQGGGEARIEKDDVRHARPPELLPAAEQQEPLQPPEEAHLFEPYEHVPRVQIRMDEVVEHHHL